MNVQTEIQVNTSIICTFFLDITGSIYFQQFSEVDTSQEHTGYFRIDFKGIAL